MSKKSGKSLKQKRADKRAKDERASSTSDCYIPRTLRHNNSQRVDEARMRIQFALHGSLVSGTQCEYCQCIGGMSHATI